MCDTTHSYDQQFGNKLTAIDANAYAAMFAASGKKYVPSIMCSL